MSFNKFTLVFLIVYLCGILNAHHFENLRRSDKKRLSIENLYFYYRSGVAHKISNTLCGKHILEKPLLQITPPFDQTLSNWKQHVTKNPTLCQCRKKGPPIEKYSYLFYLLTWLRREKVALTPHNVAYYVLKNETTHLLIDSNRTIVYYEAIKEGNLTYGFTDLAVITAQSNGLTNVRYEHFLTYLLRFMPMDKLSFSLINGNNSGMEYIISSFIDGVGAFVHDDSLPDEQKSNVNFRFQEVDYSDPTSIYAISSFIRP